MRGLDGKEPKGLILLLWLSGAWLQVGLFGHKEVKLSTLSCFALPFPSEDLPIRLFLDAL